MDELRKLELALMREREARATVMKRKLQKTTSPATPVPTAAAPVPVSDDDYVTAVIDDLMKETAVKSGMTAPLDDVPVTPEDLVGDDPLVRLGKVRGTRRLR